MLGRPPAYVTPLMGREVLLGEVRELLSRGRPVTLVGPGGVGKTRLAVEVMAAFPEARFVDLRRCTTPVQAIEAVAQALDVNGDAGPSTDVGRALCRRPRLVVLDNLEQLPGAANVLEPWVRDAVDARWLLTSRVPLGLDREHPVTVPPLADALAARALFRACIPERWRDRVDVEQIDRIVGGLGRYPLALELAARRLEVLEASDLEASLARAFFTTLADPLKPEGAHASLLEVIRQTVETLPDDTSAVLGVLSIFATPFDWAMARAVAGEGALDGLAVLCQRGLLTRSGSRFSMAEPVRRFVEEDTQKERIEAARLHFATWLAGRGEALARPALRGDPDALREIEGRFGALRDLLRSAVVGEVPVEFGVDAAWALVSFLGIRPPGSLRLPVVEEALMLPETASRREAQLHFPMVHAWWIWKRGSHAEGLELLVRANEEAKGLPAALAHGLNMEARIRSLAGEDTNLLLERSRRLATAAGYLHLAVMSQIIQSYGHLRAGRAEEAQTLAESALKQATASGHLRTVNEAEQLLGFVALRRYRFDEARRWYSATIESSRALGDRRRQAYCLCQQAVMDDMDGHLEQALSAFEEAHAAFVELDAPLLMRETSGHRARVLLELGDLDGAELLLQRPRDERIVPAVFDAFLAAGRGRREDYRVWCERADPRFSRWLDHLAAMLDASVETPPALAPPEDPFLMPLHRAAAQIDAVIRRSRGLSVCVAADGGSVMLDGHVTRFAEGSPNVRVLKALTAERGRFLDVQDLFAAGWPSQKATASARRNRVNVALSTLRKAGLKGVLERGDDGWRLPADLPVV